MPHKYLAPPNPEELGLETDARSNKRPSGRELPKMKKFRFQLMADFIVEHFKPCSVADIAGGKGLLAYLLQQRGFNCMVVDPVQQALPERYRDLSNGKRIVIPQGIAVPRINRAFEQPMAKDFELLVGLHAHGVNIMMLDAVLRYACTAIVLPCCVIDEPNAPSPGQDWFSWLVDCARRRGLITEFFSLNFKGQNVGFIVNKARVTGS